MPRNPTLGPKPSHRTPRKNSSEVLVLGIASCITLGVFLIQGVILKFFADSLTLRADTVHVLSDVLVNFGAFFIAWFMLKKSAHEAQRIERRFMLLGLVVLCIGAAWTVFEAIEKIGTPVELQGWWLVLGGVVGGLGNFLSHAVLSRIPHKERTHKHKLVHLHVLEDMILSGIVIISGIGGILFGAYHLDSYLSIFAVLWVLKRAYTIAQGLWQGKTGCGHHH
ncbi:MAG: cation transporter [Minisyncoccota bacterium]